MARTIPNNISAVVFDFDGVMTDNRVLIFSDGTEAVIADRSDGMGIDLLRRRTSLQLLVLSTETDPVVMHRCKKLRLQCLSGVHDKLPELQNWLSLNSLDPSECIYVGNDINDTACMEFVGWAVAPSDADTSALAVADFVLKRSGGRGAVRELANFLIDYLSASGEWVDPGGAPAEAVDEGDHPQ